MPTRMLAWPAMIGITAHALRWWAMSAFGVDAAMGAGIACLLVGAALVPVMRKCHLPFAVVGFASVVSLMPGIFIFRMGSALLGVQQQSPAGTAALVGDALSDAITALLIVVAMTLGPVMPKHLYNPLVAPSPSHGQPGAGMRLTARGAA